MYGTSGFLTPATEIPYPGEAPPRTRLGFGKQMMALDAVAHLPDDILVKVDRAAMALSLETRSLRRSGGSGGSIFPASAIGSITSGTC